MTLFLQFFGFCLAICAVCGAIGFAFVLFEDGEAVKAAVLGIVLLGVIVGGATYMTRGESAMERCLTSGRAWMIAGYHTELRYDAVLKVAMSDRVRDYKCIEVP